MRLSGLHLLLTYRCIYECDHCFVWGGPRQEAAMTLGVVREVLDQAERRGGIRWIYLEGGEAFLYYPTMLAAAREAAGRGFQVGMVTNAYWATSPADAEECLRPLAGLVQDLSLSRDTFHGNDEPAGAVRYALDAAARLGIPASVISVPDGASGGECGVMYRGRAVEKLADKAPGRPWETLTTCPHEDLRDPERVHVDPMGWVHLCQGLLMGNIFRSPLERICSAYDPETHPVVGPLLHGGPAELARRYGVPHPERCADACHLCDVVRRALRPRFPELLGPDPAYGVLSEE